MSAKVRQYRKKPVVIEALLFDGTNSVQVDTGYRP